MNKRYILLVPLLLTGCGPAKQESTAGSPLQITAAGATFPAPIYQKWFADFHNEHPDVQINYQPIGSGAGIQQLLKGTVDFGASDMPLKDEELSKFNVHPLHFPTVLGAVVPTYNTPGMPSELKFSGATLAGIFLGKIKKWNDKALAADNPGVQLPATDIVVVHRSDGSGTSFVWTDYLSKVSPEWKTKVGANTSVSWPVGIGGKGNDGVAGAVSQTANSLGYVELTYAVQSKMPYGLVKNASGQFIKASLESVSGAAASAAQNMPADFRVSITNAPGEKAYPISTFTWLLIPSHISDARKAQAIKSFLNWMLTTGQRSVSVLSYAPLPKEVVVKVSQQIAEIQ
jgi:phosphate transport system substrate-binding protein